MPLPSLSFTLHHCKNLMVMSLQAAPWGMGSWVWSPVATLCQLRSSENIYCSHPFILVLLEGNGTPLQYSCLENPRDGGAWWAAVHGVAKSWTQLSDFTFTFHFHFSLSCIGEGNGNPLQCSCLENPRDGGAWWAAVFGVAQIGT